MLIIVWVICTAIYADLFVLVLTIKTLYLDRALNFQIYIGITPSVTNWYILIYIIRSYMSNIFLYGRLICYLRYFWFHFYSAEIFLNTSVDNRKRDFWGPYPGHLDLHQYSVLIISKHSAACSRKLHMPPSNQQPQAIPVSYPNQA